MASHLLPIYICLDANPCFWSGSAGFVAVASDVSHDLDADAVTRSAVALVNTALEAAAVTPTLKRFVQTSSGTAALSGVPPGIEYDLAIDHFNTKALELAWAPPPHPPRQRVIIYSASKVLQEQAMWKFRDERKPKFAISAVLPDFVVGPVLDLEHQGYPSSLSLLKAAWEGDMTIANLVWPQWEIDVVDAAMLHVAAILHPDVDGERIFGYAYPKNWTNTFEYLRELYPERQFANAPEDEGEDKGNILGRPRAEELLKWVKGSGWTEYKVSLKGVCDTLV